MNILFIGDIVGEVGRRVVYKEIERLISQIPIDFIIANGENATHGKGLIESHFNELLDVESFVSVYPTILVDDYIVNIESNIEQYNIVLTDAAGKVILTKEDMSMSSMLELAHLPRGIYILQAANKTFKLIKK